MWVYETQCVGGSRWGSEHISEPEVRYCLKLLMVKSVIQLLKVSLPLSLHFLSSQLLSLFSVQQTVSASYPSICAQGLTAHSLPLISLYNLCFQLVLRKSLFNSHTPTQPALLLPSLPSFLPHHFQSASSLSFAFLPLPRDKKQFMSKSWERRSDWRRARWQSSMKWAGTQRMGQFTIKCCLGWIIIADWSVKRHGKWLLLYCLLQFVLSTVASEFWPS